MFWFAIGLILLFIVLIIPAIRGKGYEINIRIGKKRKWGLHNDNRT